MEPRQDVMSEELKRERRKQAAQFAPDAATPSSTRIVNNYMGPAEEPEAPTEQVRTGPTGFVGFGQQQAANVEASQRMAQQVGKAALESGQVGLLGSQEGRQALLEKALGKAAGVSPLDAALAGAAGGDYFAELEAQYGPEAQARRTAEREAAQKEARATQEEMNRREAERRTKPPVDYEAAAANEASRLRSIDANRPRGQMTVERWANLHGMTLEQWIKGGKKPAY